MFIIYFIIGFMVIMSVGILVFLIARERKKYTSIVKNKTKKIMFYPEKIQHNKNLIKFSCLEIETNKKVRGSVRYYNGLVENTENLSILSESINSKLKLQLGESYYEYFRQKI